jgi:hypothetical protein
MTTPTATLPRSIPGRLLLALGIGLPVLGVIGYIVQLAAQRLLVPWYLPGAATLGVLLVAVALWQRRTMWRMLALVLVVLFAAAAWALPLASRLPAYAGPVESGRSFPAFVTKRADGTAFTQRHLEGDQGNVLVFFRGRW